MNRNDEITPEISDAIKKELLRQYADQLGVELEVVSVQKVETEPA